MSLDATFYSFPKRANSSKTPADNTAGVTFDVNLKDTQSMDTPALILSADSFSYDYCKFNNQYFFVDDVISVRNGIWEIRLVKDLLASYKSEIGATSAFILYANTTNTEIVDTRLSLKTTQTVSFNATPLADHVSAAGSYLCCVTGERSTNIFKVPNPAWIENIIGDSSDGLAAYLSAQFPDIDQWTEEEWLKGLMYYVKQTGKNLIGSGSNVLSNIRSLMWVPWNVQTSQTGSFDLGIFHTGAIGSKVTTIFDDSVTDVNIPWQFTDWRRNEPYTHLYLYIPFVGLINIPVSQVIGQSQISIEVAFNQTSGEIAFRVYTGGGIQLGAYGANTGIDIPIGSSNISTTQKMTSLFGTAGGVGAAIATGNVIGGAAVAAASLAAVHPLTATVGGIGGGAGGALDLNIRCFTVCHNTAHEPATIAATVGVPYGGAATIGSFSGFVQTQNASVSGSMEAHERDEINRLLDGGIFYE